LCFRKTGGLLERVQDLGFDPYEVPLHRTLMRPHTALAILRLAARLRAEGAALVHCHDMYSVVLGVPAAHLAGVPATPGRRDRGPPVPALQRPFLRLAMRRAPVVLATAATVAAQLEIEEGLPPHRMAIVPNGLDVAVFDAAAAREPEAPAPL